MQGGERPIRLTCNPIMLVCAPDWSRARRTYGIGRPTDASARGGGRPSVGHDEREKSKGTV